MRMAAAMARARPTAAAPAPGTGVPRSAAIIIDADPHGTIVLDGRARYSVVRRDGTVALHQPTDTPELIAASCLARCPDAVLSAGIDAANSPDVADPDPNSSSTDIGGGFPVESRRRTR
jgi:hypothetical protein